ncbi:SAV_2336 N-terminal domain-related protein [Streptomyces sp. NPDC002845]
MASGDGTAEGVGQLAELLAEAGGEPPTSVELAELLWLAGRMEAPEESGAAEPEAPDAPAAASTPAVPSPAAPPPPPAQESTEPEDPDPASDSPNGRVPLRLPGRDTAATGNSSHTSLLAPAPPMLSHPLALQRALRPLKRRVPAPYGLELDEEATAHRIARLGAGPRWWLPVLRPATERWLTLHLVYDSGPTMPVWRPLVRELRTALAQSGIFRTVRVHRLAADGTVRRPDAQETPDRAVTLLVSDCMGPQWRQGPAGDRWYRTVRRWAARMPVAVVQPLPERLWRTTALPATTARIASPSPGAPNAAYDVDSYALDGTKPGTLALPVLEPSAPWLANWSRMVAGSGPVTGAVGLLGSAPPPAPVDHEGRGDVERLSAEELVLRFRSMASPEAFRLAGHLAVGRAELPVMRLVHAAVEPNPRPQHLAEVILSGVLTTVPGPAGSYEFRQGVREILLRTLPRTAHGRTSELLARVGALIDERAGVAAGDIRVAAPGGGEVAAEGEPFAAVREESLERLGGTPPRQRSRDPELVLNRYRLLQELGRGSRVWRALDTRLDRTVAVYRYDIDEDRHEQFMESANALTEIFDVHVITVLDYGIDDGVPYLVREFVEGITLSELTAQGGFRLPYWILAPLAHQVARGLSTVHHHGLGHGRLAPDNIVVRPDGSFAVTRFTLGTVRRGTERKDFRDLGRLLIELAGGGTGAPDQQEESEGELPRGRRLFRARFSEAVVSLVAPDLDEQRRGRDQLLSPHFDEVLQAAASDRYRYRLLGPVLVTQRDRALPAASPEEQALLCMLLLGRGKPVADADLATGLWGKRPPENASPLLASHAARLRELLGPGIVATTSHGYAIYAPSGTLDVHRFEEVAAEAQSLRERGDPAAARTAVRSALDLWQGDALDGVPGPAARRTRTRHLARHLALCTLRAELDLELGDFDQAASDLADQLQDRPRDEGLRRLYERAMEGLRSAPKPDRGMIVVELAEPSAGPEDLDTLGRTLHRALSLSDLAPDQYELLARDNGHVLLTEPGADILSVLDVMLVELPDSLGELEEPIRVRITAWHTARFDRTDRPATHPGLEEAFGRTSADIVVVLSPVLHDRFTSSGRPDAPGLFRPLRGETGAPPFAWYHALTFPESASEPRDLVRGPFTTRDLTLVRAPEQGRTAVVLTQPDGSLALLDPDRPPPASPATYYRVDLTTHRVGHELSLPSSGDGVFTTTANLSWHVDDPVAFVRGESVDISARLIDHLAREAGRITRRHPLRRAAAAQHAVHAGVRGWPVPGVSVACSVWLTPEGEPSAVAPRPPEQGAAAVLADAEAVLLGFDDPLTQLYAGWEVDRANRDLAALLVELRDPDAALRGEPLVAPGASSPPTEMYPTPLDLIRGLADHRQAAGLLRELDRIEEQAARKAWPRSYVRDLLRVLAATGRTPAVVTDVSADAVATFLRRRSLTRWVTGGVHSRSEDVTKLLPNPDCLLRALDQQGASPSSTVLIGSTVAELTAARTLGIRFIGYARSQKHERHLRSAGCEHTVTYLDSLLQALRPTT